MNPAKNQSSSMLLLSGEDRLTRLGYASYVGICVVGGTLIIATAYARHVVVFATIPEWTVGFVCLFLGGLVASRFKSSLIRTLVVAVSAALAWTIVVAVMPFRNVPAGMLSEMPAMLSGVSESWLSTACLGLWGWLLAFAAELILPPVRRISERLARPAR